jgi:transposase
METATQTAVHHPPETTNQLLRQVRKYTRRKFAAEDKIRIILEGLKREVSVSELCRIERISPHIYYAWLKDFMEAGKARLKGDSKRHANTGEVDALRMENEQLKVLVAEKTLENALLKKSLVGSENYGTSK